MVDLNKVIQHIVDIFSNLRHRKFSGVITLTVAFRNGGVRSVKENKETYIKIDEKPTS